MNTEKSYCVYAHVNKINGKIYIGQSKNISSRWAGEGRGYKGCRYFYQAIIKYGWNTFEHLIIKDNLTIQQSNKLEEFLIQTFHTQDRKIGYNILYGGNNKTQPREIREKIRKANRNRIISEETREKIRKARIGYKMPEETREKIRKARIGYKMPEEQKVKLSKYWKGRKRNLSEEGREKIRESNRNRIISEETREKMRKNNSGKNNPMYGKKVSKDTIEKRLATIKRKKRDNSHK